MATTTKKDIIDRIAQATGQHPAVVKRIILQFLDSIIVELCKGNRLEFREFGTFEVRQRKAHMGQNPQNLEPVQVPAKRTAKFKPGRTMKQAVAERSRGR